MQITSSRLPGPSITMLRPLSACHSRHDTKCLKSKEKQDSTIFEIFKVMQKVISIMNKGHKGKQVRGELEYWGWHKEGVRFDAFWEQNF